MAILECYGTRSRAPAFGSAGEVGQLSAMYIVSPFNK